MQVTGISRSLPGPPMKITVTGNVTRGTPATPVSTLGSHTQKVNTLTYPVPNKKKKTIIVKVISSCTELFFIGELYLIGWNGRYGMLQELEFSCLQSCIMVCITIVSLSRLLLEFRAAVINVLLGNSWAVLCRQVVPYFINVESRIWICLFYLFPRNSLQKIIRKYKQKHISIMYLNHFCTSGYSCVHLGSQWCGWGRVPTVPQCSSDEGWDRHGTNCDAWCLGLSKHCSSQPDADRCVLYSVLFQI